MKLIRLESVVVLSLFLAWTACSSNLGGPGESNESNDLDDSANASGGSFASGGYTSSAAGGSADGSGASSSGTGGSNETLGTGGNESVDNAMPSPGCGKGPGPESGIVYEPSGSSSGPGWLIFPEKYDGNTPLPVLVGFHGCGGGGDQNGTPFLDITRNSGFETDYIVMAPVADPGGCYSYDADMPRAKALFTQLVNNYCVDLNRVFGTGHSYGAGGMLMTLTDSTKAADFAHFNFKGIAPVAGWPVWDPEAVVPTMYIQGVTDSERDHGDGKAAVDKIVDVNQCGMSTTPYPVDACISNHDDDPVNAGCRRYDGCMAETVWCSHDDSDYGGSFHGIPCFYRQAVYDFFESL